MDFFWLLLVGKTHYVSSGEGDGRQNGLWGTSYGSSLFLSCYFHFSNTNSYVSNVTNFFLYRLDLLELPQEFTRHISQNYTFQRFG